MKYIYPKLPAVYTTPFFRIGGNGLANCLFVYAKAIVVACETNATIIYPTWFNLSIGTYLRRQIDKRHYGGIFSPKEEVFGLKKVVLLIKHALTGHKSEVKEFSGIYDFFDPLLGKHKIVKDYILTHLQSHVLKEVDNFNFKGTVAVHIRLGDYPTERRISFDWYIDKIKEHSNQRILLFSDGTDEELSPLLEIENTERVFFGGAIQDIIAISRCEYLIGSDSSFSAWGAYLGQVPCVFYKLQFGIILDNPENQIIENL